MARSLSTSALPIFLFLPLLLLAESAGAQSGAPVVPTPAFDVPRPPQVPALGRDGVPGERVGFTRP